MIVFFELLAKAPVTLPIIHISIAWKGRSEGQWNRTKGRLEERP